MILKGSRIRVIHQDAIAYNTEGKFDTLDNTIGQKSSSVLLVFNRDEMNQAGLEELLNFTRDHRLEKKATYLFKRFAKREDVERKIRVIKKVFLSDRERFQVFADVTSNLFEDLRSKYGDEGKDDDDIFSAVFDDLKKGEFAGESNADFIDRFQRENKQEIEEKIRSRMKKAVCRYYGNSKTEDVVVDAFCDAQSDDERLNACRDYINSKLEEVEKDKENFLARMEREAEEKTKDSLGTKASKFLDTVQKGFIKALRPLIRPIGYLDLSLRNDKAAIPKIFKVLLFPLAIFRSFSSKGFYNFKVSLADRPPTVGDAGKKTRALMKTLDKMPEAKAILEERAVDIYLADDKRYLWPGDYGGLRYGFVIPSSNNMFIRSDLVSDKNTLRHEASHLWAYHMDKFDRRDDFQEAALADLENDRTLKVLKRNGIWLLHPDSSYEGDKLPKEILVEIEHIKYDIYMGDRRFSEEHADKLLAEQFPNSFPFFKEFCRLRDVEIEKIKERKSKVSEHDIPEKIAKKVRDIINRPGKDKDSENQGRGI